MNQNPSILPFVLLGGIILLSAGYSLITFLKILKTGRATSFGISMIMGTFMSILGFGTTFAIWGNKVMTTQVIGAVLIFFILIVVTLTYMGIRMNAPIVEVEPDTHRLRNNDQKSA